MNDRVGKITAKDARRVTILRANIQHGPNRQIGRAQQGRPGGGRGQRRRALADNVPAGQAYQAVDALANFLK